MMFGWGVLLLILVVVVVVATTDNSSPRARQSPSRSRLDERLASGELTLEEHAERVAVLEESHHDDRFGSWLLLLAVAVAVLLLAGVVGWAASGYSMGSWGDHDGRMAGHMGWSTASGGADRPVAGARDIQVVATDLAFEPRVVEIRAGEPVNITLANDGAVFHDLSIPQLGFVLDADPGQQVSGSLTVDEPGSYEFECGVPGHADAGMRGTLEVRGGSS